MIVSNSNCFVVIIVLERLLLLLRKAEGGRPLLRSSVQLIGGY